MASLDVSIEYMGRGAYDAIGGWYRACVAIVAGGRPPPRDARPGGPTRRSFIAPPGLAGQDADAVKKESHGVDGVFEFLKLH